MLFRSGKYAYTTNTASNSVSSYRVRRDGSAMLSETIAATTAAGPIDMAIGGRTLNVLTSQGLVSFAIASNGVLTELVTNTATAGANGLVVLGE